VTVLYILTFRDVPRIKIGISGNLSARLDHLGSHLFDSDKSYLVTSKINKCIRLLERNLHETFSEDRVTGGLINGNTEVFKDSILPKVLTAVEIFRDYFFQSADLNIQKGLGAYLKSEWLRQEKARSDAAMNAMSLEERERIEEGLRRMRTGETRSKVKRRFTLKRSFVAREQTGVPL
jgi:hypothetical protein